MRVLAAALSFFFTQTGFAASVASELIAALDSLPESRDLLTRAVTKAGAVDTEAFFKSIQPCAPGATIEGSVTSSASDKMLHLPRELSELVGNTGGLLMSPLQRQRDFYLKKAKEAPAWTSSGFTEPVDIRFEPDLVEIRQRVQSDVICVKEDAPLSQRFATIVHELTHFVNKNDHPDRQADVPQMSLDEYARRTVLSPGDEVDAFSNQLSLTYKKFGKSALHGNPMLRFLDEYGSFNGDRDGLATHILTAGGYMDLRYRAEYKTVLTFLRDIEKSRHHVMIQLVNFRTQEESMYSKMMITPHLTGQEQITRENPGPALAKAAGESRKRVLKSALESSRKIQEIEKRLAELNP